MTNEAFQIWSGISNPTQIDKTANFKGCDLVLVNALGIGNDEYDIAFTLVIDSVADTKYLGGSVEVPNVNLGIKEVNVDTERLDTGFMLTIPEPIAKSLNNCWICFASSYQINIEIFAINTKAVCACTDEFKTVNDKLDYIRNLINAIGVNQLAQDAVLALFGTVIGAGLAIPTGGTSLALPAATASAVAIPVKLLTTVVILGG